MVDNTLYRIIGASVAAIWLAIGIRDLFGERPIDAGVFHVVLALIFLSFAVVWGVLEHFVTGTRRLNVVDALLGLALVGNLMCLLSWFLYS